MTGYVRWTDYTPPPCGTCGSNRIRVDWVFVGTHGDPNRWLPGLHICRDCWPFNEPPSGGELDYPPKLCGDTIRGLLGGTLSCTLHLGHDLPHRNADGTTWHPAEIAGP